MAAAARCRHSVLTLVFALVRGVRVLAGPRDANLITVRDTIERRHDDTIISRQACRDFDLATEVTSDRHLLE